MEALAALASCNCREHERRAIIAAGGVATLLAVLRDHGTCADAVREGATLLASFAGCVKQAGAMVEAGCVPLAVGLLRAYSVTHTWETLTAANGVCQLLAALTGNSAAGRAALRDAVAAPALVAALRVHAFAPTVAVAACKTLANAALTSEGADAVIAAGGLPQLLRVLEHHANDPDVVAVALSAAGEPVENMPGHVAETVAFVPAMIAA